MDLPLGAFCIALAGVILNLANFLYTQKKTRDEALRQRTFSSIDELIERTRETADETQRHISWESGRSTAAQIYRLERKCRLALQSVVSLVGARGVSVENAFAAWNSQVFGEGFPVSKKEHKFLPASARYTGIATAQQNLEAVLNQLIADGCVSTARPLRTAAPENRLLDGKPSQRLRIPNGD